MTSRFSAAFFPTLLLCSVLPWSGPAPGDLASEEPALIEAIVSRVIDGSTLDAQVNGQRTPVGLLGAETLPANTPCGQAALARSRELAGSRVFLQADPIYDLDAMNRRLYYAYTPDGVSIDGALVGQGLARAVRVDASGGAELVALEADAQVARRGCLWDGS